MTNIIEVNNLNKTYGTKIKNQVLFDINLNIKNGEFTAIIGESGSGKSTLLNMISTLDKPSSGSITVDNDEISTLNNKNISKIRNTKIGFIFQFHFLVSELTVIENVLAPSYIKNKGIKKDYQDRAKELLKIVGLEKYINVKATELSGGQMQRVAIARSLINSPKIVFADEPTGNLDSKTTEEIYALLRKINKELKTTFIIITHNRKIAQKADRIIEIEDGRIKNNLIGENY